MIHNGNTIENFPARLEILEECKPVYRELPGWMCDISGCRTYEELPDAAKDYVKAIEETTGVPVKIISVGPRRDQTIIREKLSNYTVCRRFMRSACQGYSLGNRSLTARSPQF